MKKICQYCKREYITVLKRSKFCSRDCYEKDRTVKNRKFWKNRKWLYQKYVVERLSYEKIAKMVGSGSTTIEKWAKKFGIKSRTNFKSDNYSWKGGIVETARGYIYQMVDNHPRAIGKVTKEGKKYVPQHRLVMEKYLGRYLKNSERIHHKDGNRRNNKISNLVLCDSNRDHAKLEQRINSFAKQLIWGDLKPEIKKELQKLFKEFFKK